MKPFGQYQLLRRLAAGGMAEVFLATGPNPVNAELLAVKLIHAHIAEDPGFMAMFVDEARVTAPLAHPNLVRIFDLGQAEGRLYLAMEFIRGYPLHVIQQRAELRGAILGPNRAAAIVEQAARGLHAAHEARGPKGELLNLVHRDISPQNLMLDQDGVVKVVDFGVAKAAGQLATSQKGGLKGKAGYSAPEQLRHKPIDRRADVYALGTVLFQVATGEPLFPGKSEAEILQRMLFEPLPDLRARRDLPPELASIILKAISPDPDARFPTAHALAQVLAEFLLTSGTGRPQLAQLMSQLFPPFPRTVDEAVAETSPANPRITGATPVVARPPPSAAPPADEAPTTVGRAEMETTRPDQLPLNPDGTRGAPNPNFVPDDQSATIAGSPPTQVTVTGRGRMTTAGDPDRTITGERTGPSGSNRLPWEPSGPNRMGRVAEPSDETTTTTTTSGLGLAEQDGDTRTETKPQAPPRRPGAPPRLPPWLWLAVGAAAGLMAVGVFWGVRSHQPAPKPHAVEPLLDPSAVAANHPPPAVQPVEPAPTPAPQPEATPAPEVKPAVEPQPPHKSATGTLTVLASPWARVRVDGKDIGVTPLYKRVLAAGRHKLELSNPSVKAHKVLSIVVTAHKENVQKVVLK